MTTKKISEKDMAAAVVEFMTNDKWDVYPEVSHRGKRADLVCVRNKLVHIIEIKCSMSLAVLGQIEHWKGSAHFRTVAIPVPKNRGYGRGFADKWCRQNGIGQIWVGGYEGCRYGSEPFLDRSAHKGAVTLRNKLCEGHKTIGVAGTQNEYWTPFKQTCSALRDVVESNPGIELGDALKKIKHHYKTHLSAMSSLYQWISAGIVKGVSTRYEDSRHKLYIQEK